MKLSPECEDAVLSKQDFPSRSRLGLPPRLGLAAAWLGLLLAPGLARGAEGGVCAAGREAGATSLAVHHYLYDPALKQLWAVVIDCRHPQWPAALEPIETTMETPMETLMKTTMGTPMETTMGRTVATPAEGVFRTPGAAAVTAISGKGSPGLIAGEAVRLWKQATASPGSASIELSGVAVESAPLGGKVRVRAGDPGVVLRGLVRGPHSVELLEGRPSWQQP
jgi:hypothetical protein